MNDLINVTYIYTSNGIQCSKVERVCRVHHFIFYLWLFEVLKTVNYNGMSARLWYYEVLQYFQKIPEEFMVEL